MKIALSSPSARMRPLRMAMASVVLLLVIGAGLWSKGVGGYLHEWVAAPFGVWLFPANILLNLVELKILCQKRHCISECLPVEIVNHRGGEKKPHYGPTSGVTHDNGRRLGVRYNNWCVLRAHVK